MRGSGSRRRRSARLAWPAGLLLAACGSGDATDGPARDAKANTLSAPYLVVSQPGGRELFLSPALTVIKRHGRVLAWVTPREEFTRRERKPCYDRHTDFNRDDVRQARTGAWPTTARDLALEERDGVRVLSGRESHTDFADTEVEMYLDEAGRVTQVRQRPAEFGAVPAGRWQTWRYRYPTKARFARLAGPRPRPRC